MPEPTVTVYDSVLPGAWPADARYLLCYMDGRFAANYAAGVATGATVVTITVRGGDAEADCGDVERGCMWPNTQGAQWARGRIAAGHRPTLYTFESNWAALVQACAALGIGRGQVDWFIAKWDGVAVVPPGAVAKQHTSTDTLDVSVALASWGPLLVKNFTEEDDMVIKEPDGELLQLIYDGASSYWRPLPTNAAARVPLSAVIEDDGSLLSLWKVGAGGK